MILHDEQQLKGFDQQQKIVTCNSAHRVYLHSPQWAPNFFKCTLNNALVFSIRCESINKLYRHCRSSSKRCVCAYNQHSAWNLAHKYKQSFWILPIFITAHRWIIHMLIVLLSSDEAKNCRRWFFVVRCRYGTDDRNNGLLQE